MNASTTRASLRPTLVASRLWPPALTGLLGTVPLLLAKEPSGVRQLLVLTTVITSFGVGFALDDPAAVTLDASPTARRARIATRVGLLSVVVGAGTAVQIAVATNEAVGLTLPIGSWLVQQAAFVALTLVASLIAQRTLPDNMGGAAAAPTSLFLVMALAAQSMLPEPLIGQFPGSPRFGNWWYVLGAAVLALGLLTRDPGARPWRRVLRADRHANAKTTNVRA